MVFWEVDRSIGIEGKRGDVMGGFNYATRPNVVVEGKDYLDNQQFNKVYKYMCRISSTESDIKAGKGLSWNAKALWMLLLDSAKDFHFDQANSGKCLGLSVDQTRTAMKQLKEAGIVKVEIIHYGKIAVRNYKVKAYRKQDSCLMKKNSIDSGFGEIDQSSVGEFGATKVGGTNPTNIKSYIGGTNPTNIKSNTISQKDNYLHNNNNNIYSEKIVKNGRKKEFEYSEMSDNEIYTLMGDIWGERYRHIIKGDKKQRAFWRATELYYKEYDRLVPRLNTITLIGDLMKSNGNFDYKNLSFRYA